jgi:hypothetical protein
MSQLPRAANGFVDDAKITRYLLNPAHSPEAAGKAKFFAAYGFDLANWGRLKQALRNHPLVNAVSANATTPFGKKFEVTCALATPDGRDPCVVSIWIIEPPSRDPRFVTAYPNLP